MRCPHLSGTHISSCAVEKVVYIPSLFELEEYCKTPRHKKCPLSYDRVQGSDLFISSNNLHKHVTE
jgi:hypothetical protein